MAADATDFSSINKTPEEIRLTILSTICNMFAHRGYLEKKPEYTQLPVKTAENIFTVHLNKSVLKEGKPQLMVKLIKQHVTDPSNNVFLEFIKKYPDDYKIFVLYEPTEKLMAALIAHDTEVFSKRFLMCDYMKFGCSPYHCEITKPSDIKHIRLQKFPSIYQNDPQARYFGAQKGDILRTVQRSINNTEEIIYRRVIDPKPDQFDL